MAHFNQGMQPPMPISVHAGESCGYFLGSVLTFPAGGVNKQLGIAQTHTIHISSGKIRGFCVPYPGKAEPTYCGVLSHEQKWADGWKAHGNYCSGLHQPPAGIITKSNTSMKDGGEEVERHKGAHEDEDALGGSGLSRGSGGDISAVNVLDPLLVSVQEEDHGAAGPDREPRK